VVTAQPLAAQNARLGYCAARYQSFDPASGTFLAMTAIGTIADNVCRPQSEERKSLNASNSA
jgi:hypothetical protein